MRTKQLNKLKKILSIQTVSGDEWDMVDYICNQLKSRDGEYKVDTMGNIFVTKGKPVNGYYPLLMAHSDTVYDRFDGDMIIDEELDYNSVGALKPSLRAYQSDTGDACGIGADDKNGIFIILELLDKVDSVKLFIAVSEETGTQGSNFAIKTNPNFFDDISYALMFDSPKKSCSGSLMGTPLCDEDGEFGSITAPIIDKYGAHYEDHSFTDIMNIRKSFGVPTINSFCGYYNQHSGGGEYVIIDEVEEAIEMGCELLSVLDMKKYSETDFGADMVRYEIDDSEIYCLDLEVEND